MIRILFILLLQLRIQLINPLFISFELIILLEQLRTLLLLLRVEVRVGVREVSFQIARGDRFRGESLEGEGGDLGAGFESSEGLSGRGCLAEVLVEAFVGSFSDVSCFRVPREKVIFGLRVSVGGLTVGVDRVWKVALEFLGGNVPLELMLEARFVDLAESHRGGFFAYDSFG